MKHSLSLVAFGLCHESVSGHHFVLCVGFDLVFRHMVMYRSWQVLLPGFTWISRSSFLLGRRGTFRRCGICLH
jgi:hypothetical protein